MARDCFCGCGRKIDRRQRGVNKSAAEIHFLIESIQSHTLVFQRAYLEFVVARDLVESEVMEAREGVATTEELVTIARAHLERIAEALHENVESGVDERALKDLRKKLIAMDANLRKYCFQSGLDYADIPALGSEGIVAFVEEQDSRDRARLRIDW